MKHKAIELDPRKLVVSEQYQARKTVSQTPLPQLADSIATVGLLHALAVVKSKNVVSMRLLQGDDAYRQSTFCC